jgi:hypothetical protein
MIRVRKFLIGMLSAIILVAPAASYGAELSDETLRTWDAYVQTANAQMRDRVNGNFLWVDDVPNRDLQVRAGKILISPVGQQNPKTVPSGLIHDWIGAVFIPDASLENVLSAVRDYDHYKDFYKPTIVDSKSLGTSGSCDKYSMRAVNKEIVAETALDGEYEACYFHLDQRRWYSIAQTTRVHEIRNYGRPGAQELPPNQGSGYIWRVYSVARFEERDGGVYVELEVIVLSRDIPTAIRWLVNPIVRSLSRNSMSTSLRQMEEAVRSTAGTQTGPPEQSSVAANSRESAGAPRKR